MTGHIVTTVGPAELDAARLLLARMGITPTDLLTGPPNRTAAPTFAEYIPVVAGAVSDASRRAYRTYWKKIINQWGDRRLDEPTPSDVKQLAEHIRTHVVVRRNGRGGRSAVENFITALRCLYRHAVADGHLSEAANPARQVDKPRRLPSTRRAVPLRLHTETACRRGGALALRPTDLDPDQCLILLHEKGDTLRWQPVSPTLMTHLQHHAAQRHAPPAGQLLRYRDGRPITHRRYDHLWRRIGTHLPWVATQQISTHWLRHTTLTWVEMSEVASGASFGRFWDRCAVTA